jgi:hypothetical protein
MWSMSSRLFVALGAACGTLTCVSAAWAQAPPEVIAPADGAAVTQATDAIVLAPHNELISLIQVATSPTTLDQYRGQPAGSDPTLKDEVGRFGYEGGACPPCYGTLRGATRYPLADLFFPQRNSSGVVTKTTVRLIPGQTYYYRVGWSPIWPGFGSWTPIRSFTVSAPTPAPAPTPPTQGAARRLPTASMPVVRDANRVLVYFRGTPRSKPYWGVSLTSAGRTMTRTGGPLQGARRITVTTPMSWASKTMVAMTFRGETRADVASALKRRSYASWASIPAAVPSGSTP